MSSAARIDELTKKFEENPRRYFAPLANEYRKAGDLEQAIAICRQHLLEQPGHMSGHIVFGQALFEAAQYDEAKQVFEAALGLDPENLIALRHLGDIARLAGDGYAARGWYMRVLDADPRNEEIAGLAAELASAEPLLAEPAMAEPVMAEPAMAEPVMAEADAPTDQGVEAITLPAIDETTETVAAASREPETIEVPIVSRPAPSAAEAATVEFIPVALEAPLVPRPERKPPPPSPLPPTIEIPAISVEEARARFSTPLLEIAQEPAAHVPLASEPAPLELEPFEPLALEPPPPSLPMVEMIAEASPLPDFGLEVLDGSGEGSADSLLGLKGLPEPESPIPMPTGLPDSAFDEPALLGVSKRAESDLDEMDNPLGDLAAKMPVSEDVFLSAGGDLEDDYSPPVVDVVVEPIELGTPLDTRVTPTVPMGASVVGEVVSAVGEFDLTTGEQPIVQEALGPVVPVHVPLIAASESAAPIASDEVAPEPVTPFVTETMADLYASQGLYAQAADVYRQLLAQRPGDAGLQRRIHDMDARLTPVAPVATEGPTMREFLAQLALRRPIDPAAAATEIMPPAPVVQAEAPVAEPAPVPEPVVAAVAATIADVGVGAAEDALSALFGAPASASDDAAARTWASLFTPPAEKPVMAMAAAEPAPAITGQPTRPAERELSLSSVFRAPTPSQVAATPRNSASFSFDQFFAPAKDRTTGAAPAAPAEGDITEFNSWLEGLKKK